MTVTTAPTPDPALQQPYGAPFYPPVAGTSVILSPEQKQAMQLRAFWESQKAEIQQLEKVKNHSLPLARIKKIMKADEDVKMIAGEAPAVFSRACEMFILEMTMRAWNNTVGHKRRTLQKSDIAAAILQTEIFDFLVDIIPRDDNKEEAKAEPAFPFCFYPQGVAAGTALMTLLDNPVDHYAWERQQFAEQTGGSEVGGFPKSDE